jgi:hypothetical protein
MKRIYAALADRLSGANIIYRDESEDPNVWYPYTKVDDIIKAEQIVKALNLEEVTKPVS